jgi:tRNA threonylcarbamoyladenosine biosynthesis protein TsaE
MERSAYLPDAAALRALGEALGQALAPGTVLLLSGPLGAGKTTLAQGIARGLGIGEVVASPTFTLIHELSGAAAGPDLLHVDLYRLETPEQVLALGLAEELGREDRILVVEWPERAPGLWPPGALTVSLAVAGEGRRVTLSATSGPGLGALERLAAARPLAAP